MKSLGGYMEGNIAVPAVNSGSSVSNESSQPVSNSAPTQAEQKAAFEKKLKVNGKERVVTSEQELEKLAQMGLSAHEKYNEAKQIQSQAEEMKSLLKSDVAKALEKAGYTKEEIKKAFEDYLIKDLEESSLSPEQKAAKEREEKLRKYEEEEENRKKSEAQKQKEREIERELQNVESELVSALQKSNLPKNPFLVKAVANKLYLAEEAGYSMDADMAVKEVYEEFTQDLNAVLSNIKDVAQLEKLLGNEVVSSLREAGVKAVKQANSPFTKPKEVVKQAPIAESKETPKVNATQFWNNLRRT